MSYPTTRHDPKFGTLVMPIAVVLAAPWAATFAVFGATGWHQELTPLFAMIGLDFTAKSYFLLNGAITLGILLIAGLCFFGVRAWTSVRLTRNESRAVETFISSFPQFPNLDWRMDALKAAEALSHDRQILVVGDEDSGTRDVSLFALRQCASRLARASATSTFIAVEVADGMSLSDLQDELLRRLGADLPDEPAQAVSAANSVGLKWQRFNRAADRAGLYLLVKNAQKLGSHDQQSLAAHLAELPTRHKVALTSTRPIPALNRCSEIRLNELTLAETRRFIERTVRVDAIERERILACAAELRDRMHGRYEQIRFSIDVTSFDEFERRSQELSASASVVTAVLSRLPDASKRVLWQLASFGNSVSKLTFVGSSLGAELSWEDFTADLLTIPDVAVYPAGERASVFIPDSVRASIKTLRGDKWPIDSQGDFASAWAPSLSSHFEGFDEMAKEAPLPHAFDVDLSTVMNVVIQLTKGNDGDLIAAERLYESIREIMFNRGGAGGFETRIRAGSEIAKSAQKRASALDPSRHEDRKRFLNIACSMYASFGSVQTLVGHYHHARLELEQGLKIASREGLMKVTLRLLRAKAGLLYRLGRIEEAERLCQSIVSPENQGVDLPNEVDALYVLIGCAMFSGHIALAKERVDEMRRRARHCGWKRGEAYAELEDAQIEALNGNLGLARSMANRALAVAERYGDQRQTARCWLVMSKLVATESGLSSLLSPSRVSQLLAQARDVFERLSMQNELAEVEATRRSLLDWRVWRKVPYRCYYGDMPIGGD